MLGSDWKQSTGSAIASWPYIGVGDGCAGPVGLLVLGKSADESEGIEVPAEDASGLETELVGSSTSLTSTTPSSIIAQGAGNCSSKNTMLTKDSVKQYRACPPKNPLLTHVNEPFETSNVRDTDNRNSAGAKG